MQKVNYGFCEFLDKLKKAGYERIGGGCFASVYGHPNKKNVLKIFQYDEPYLKYCETIINSDNPYFPQIKRILKYQSQTHTHSWFVVELEKLQPICEDDDLRQQVAKRYSVYLYRGNDEGYKYYGFENYVMQCKVEELEDTKLAEAIKTLRQVKQEHKLNYDIHAGNVMLRENHLVFTDPFFQ